ncbi:MULTISPECIES: hypothetical protein [unclassified Acinetobacter]|uniref:hypothetical protein n=1 Tax=unclassified Acinetobacter TaxID=196816 RepID=UPI0025C3F77B|nr:MULTISPECIES: hypothetical protein [unclassified Acinetobacter]
MRLKPTGATYIQSGQSLKCPRCESKQSKAFKLMPRKYPKPEQTFSEIFDSSKYEFRVFRWENSYQCQKCGNEYFAAFEDEHNALLSQQQNNKKSFFGKLVSFILHFLKWIIIIFVLLCIIVAVLD